MIEPVTMYRAVCDGCFMMTFDFDTIEDAKGEADENGWKEIDGKLYCPECAEKLENNEYYDSKRTDSRAIQI